MKIDPGCYPCALRRILATAARITDDPWLHHKLLAKAMSELSGMERDVTPAEMMQSLQVLVSGTLGTADPYAKLRSDWNDEVDGLSEAIESEVAAAEDSLVRALALSARSNVFDDECLAQKKIRRVLRDDAEPILAVSDVDLFLRDLGKAEKLLFCHDSAPELPYDRALIGQLRQARPELEVTCVVRAQPVLLDAGHEDIGRHRLLETPGVVAAIDPGVAVLGLPLNECPRDVRDRFEQSDVVLAKGQAHAETLQDASTPTYFLFRVKCAVMAKHQGLAVGDLAFVKS